MAISTGLALFYTKAITDLKVIALLVVVIGLLMPQVLGNNGLFEGFQDEGGEDRVVRYGDTVTIWSWKNSFLRSNDKTITQSPELASPSSIHRGWSAEYWVIEDPKDPSGPGNNNPIRFGEQVYLRAKDARHREHEYLRPLNNETVDMGPRGSWERVTLESSDISTNSTGLIKYGDMFYFKTWRNTYIRLNENGKYGQKKSRDTQCLFRIYDQYGQGTHVDWSRKGTATQSSVYGQFPAVNTIDGNMMTFNHTKNEPHAWWQLTLPKDVYITKIHLFNRRDCCQERLSNFTIKILDQDGKDIVSYFQKGSTQETVWNGVNRIGRIIKVQLNGRNYLHLSDFKVFGKKVDYSLLLDNPVSTDLVLTPTKFEGTNSKQFFNESLPQSDHNKSVSLMFFIKPSSHKTSTTIISKGHSDRQRSPFITLNDNRQLTISQSTKKRVDEGLNSTTKLPINQWSHVTVITSNGISPESGWLYGQFTAPITVGPRTACCYVIHPILKQMYHVPDPGRFSSSTKQTWDTSVALTMNYVGVLTKQDQERTLTLYLNGRREGQTKLTGQPVFNKAPLLISAGGNKFYIDKLQYANYAFTQDKIKRDSVYRIENATVTLISTVSNAKERIVVEPHLLPEIYNNQVTVASWVKTDRPNDGNKKWDQIFRKGVLETDRSPSMWYHTDSNHLHVMMSTKGGAKWGDGISKTKFKAKSGIWYHYAMVVKDRSVNVYINGELSDSATLPGPIVLTISPLMIGGFQGELKDFKYSNFAWTPSDVKSSMGNHPEHKQHLTIKKMWTDQGCMSDPSQGDWSSIASWSSFLKAGQEDQLRLLMKRLKAKADKGDQKAQLQCYGPEGSKLYQRLRKKERLLKFALDEQSNGKKCLPIAPFTCKRKGVNDFDIRTHQDFHKYVLASRVQPVAGTSSASQSKEVKKYRLQLAENQAMIDRLKRMKQKAETKVSDLLTTMKKMEKQSVQPVELVKAHPKYHELERQLKQKESELVIIKAEKQKMETVQSKPPTKELEQMRAELTQAKQLATANLSRSLDISQLKNNSIFKDILSNLVKQDYSKHPKFLEMKRRSEAQRKKYIAQKQQIRETTEQLQSTKQLAEELLQTFGQADTNTIKELVRSKSKLSDNPGFQKIMKDIKKTANSKEDIHQHPEYQKLVRQLNAINTETANGVSPQELVKLREQANRCKVLLKDHPDQVSQVEQLLIQKMQTDPTFARSTALKMLKKAQNDPQIKSLLGSVMWKTPEGKALVDQAARDRAAKDPQFRAMASTQHPTNQQNVINMVREQILAHPDRYASELRTLFKRSSDPVIKQALSRISSKCGRLEDHPEYHQYAQQMRQYCNMQSKRLNCYNCKI